MKPVRIREGISEAKWLTRLLALLSLLAALGAANEWRSPSAPPFRGSGRWLIDAIFQIAGTPGLVALWLLVAIGLALAARFVWRHSPRTPADRWLW